METLEIETAVELKFSRTETQGFVAYRCPHCHMQFGLAALFLEKVSEINYKMSCPYCRAYHSTEE